MTQHSSSTESNSFVERQITSSMKLILRGDSQHLAGPLFAINWFDARPAWLYHLYNFLASSQLKKIGGKPFFKGHVTRTLSGDDTLARKHLLIINYPSAEHFLNLVSGKVFLAISVLRMLSVRRFSFVMHRRVDEIKPLNEDLERAYALVHFSADEPKSAVQVIENAAQDSRVDVSFIGQESVRVVSETQSKDSQATENPMEFVTPNTMLLSAESDERLDECFRGESMQSALAQTSQHYAALIRRTV